MRDTLSGSWSRIDSSVVGSVDTRFENENFSVSGELAWNFFQDECGSSTLSGAWCRHVFGVVSINSARTVTTGSVTTDSVVLTSATSKSSFGSITTVGWTDVDEGFVSLTATGDIAVSGVLDSSAGPAGTTGVDKNEGDVFMTSTGVLLSVVDIITLGGSAALGSAVDGGSSGHIDLRPASALVTGDADSDDQRPLGVIVLSGELTALRGQGDGPG